MMEVPGFDGVHIDEDGQPWLKLPIHSDSNGYPMTKVRNKSVRIHTLICSAHQGPPAAGQVCRHLDGDCANNDPSNLAWGSQSENAADTVKHGKHRSGAKLSAPQIEQILTRLEAGERAAELSVEFGISPQRISDYKAGRYKQQRSAG